MEGLGINVPGLIAQFVNFGLLLLLLYLLLYKPILRMLDERSQRIRESLKQAERARQEAAEAQVKYEQQLEQARREGQEAIAKAMQASEKVREEIIAQAREEARQLLERAKSEIEHDRRQAMAELRNQVAELSILAAQKVLGQALDEKAHRHLIQEFLTETEELK